MSYSWDRAIKKKLMHEDKDGWKEYLVIISHVSDWDYPGKRVWSLIWRSCNRKGQPTGHSGRWPYPGTITPTFKQLKTIMDLIKTREDFDEMIKRMDDARMQIDTTNRVIARLKGGR
jgi:hypothetical protein